MKKMLLVCIVIAFLFGCERNSPLEDYGDTVVESYERVGGVADEASLQAARRSIRSYKTMNGKYPASIEEVAATMSGAFNAELYVYDPATGRIDFK